MTAIPGAEFAPIIARTVIDLGPEGSEYQLEREIRWRADVADPDDQRAIWRLAAIRMGATEEDASSAILIDCPYQVNPTESHSEFRLSVGGTIRLDSLWEKERGVLWVLRPGRRASLAHATAALCRAVGWPR